MQIEVESNIEPFALHKRCTFPWEKQWLRAADCLDRSKTAIIVIEIWSVAQQIVWEKQILTEFFEDNPVATV